MSEKPTQLETPEKSSHEWYQQIFWAQVICCTLTLAFLCIFYCRVTELSHNTIETNKSFVEQISIEPIKDKTGNISFKTNIDDVKKTIGKGYNKNHQEFMQAYYETQSNWLNFWMTLLAIILAAFGLIIPLSFMKLYEIKASELQSKHNEMLSKIQKDVEDVNKKLSEVQKLTKQAKESEEIARAQTSFMQAYKLADSKRYKEAIDEYNKAIKYYEKYEKSPKIDEQIALCYNNIGDSLIKLKKHEEAVKYFDLSINQYSENYLAFNNRAAAHGYLKQFELALNDANKAIGLYPDYADAYNNRGNAYFNLKEFDKALVDFEKAVYLNPNDSSFYANLTEVYLELENYDGALSSLNLAMLFDELDNEELTNFINELEERLAKERPDK